jgi:transcriptional regulator with XRE-family HTH domain
VVIAERLKTLRKQRKLSQGDIEKRTGLLRCYVSRVENGRTVPGIETLEKLAGAVGVPVYHFFYKGEKPRAVKFPRASERVWGGSSRDARTLYKFRRLLAHMREADRKLLLQVAQIMSQKTGSSAADKSKGSL